MAAKRSQQVRIIGGKWKGRKLRFREHAQLRPTLSRTRETLFNWLRPSITGMTCLDLFSGSGALGFEALSHGASASCLVDKNNQVCRDLHQSANALNANCQIFCQSAQQFVVNTQQKFDLIFIDPPFNSTGLLQSTLADIKRRGIATALLYVEFRDLEVIQAISQDLDWPITHSTRSGDTHSVLLEVVCE